MIVIPTFQESSSDFVEQIELDGTIYRLRFTWNVRNEVWYMDISDKDGNPLILGLALVANYLLLEGYQCCDRPVGDFYLWDTLGEPNNTGVTFDNLGTRYILIYVTAGELGR